MTFIPRAAAERLSRLAQSLRIVIVNGPRQSGKTTLLRDYLARHGGSYRSLDDASELEKSDLDARSYALHGEPPRIIDEVQRGGDNLVRAIKIAVDEDPEPGRFILSGSSRFLTIPTLSESLAGRAVFVDMWPLSVAERTGGPTNFIDRIFSNLADESRDSAWERSDYLLTICSGGFPEALTLTDPLANDAWYSGYLATIINRDIGDFAQVHYASALPRILRLIAARAGSPLVHSDIAQSMEMSWQATKNYISYFDMVFLTITVPAWSSNLTSKITKTPKVFVSDSGLAAHLLQVDDNSLDSSSVLGNLVETFVANEITKLLTFAQRRVNLWHLRDRSGIEVDLLLEDAQGSIIGIEVKATSTPRASAAKHLHWLRDKLGSRFAGGIVLHLGKNAGSFGNNIYALPLSALWGHSSLPSMEDI